MKEPDSANMGVFLLDLCVTGSVDLMAWLETQNLSDKLFLFVNPNLNHLDFPVSLNIYNHMTCDR